MSNDFSPDVTVNSYVGFYVHADSAEEVRTVAHRFLNPVATVKEDVERHRREFDEAGNTDVVIHEVVVKLDGVEYPMTVDEFVQEYGDGRS